MIIPRPGPVGPLSCAANVALPCRLRAGRSLRADGGTAHDWQSARRGGVWVRVKDQVFTTAALQPLGRPRFQDWRGKAKVACERGNNKKEVFVATDSRAKDPFERHRHI